MAHLGHIQVILGGWAAGSHKFVPYAARAAAETKPNIATNAGVQGAVCYR